MVISDAYELVEVTPSKIRLRKKVLSDEGRKRAERGSGKKGGV
jgi:GTP-binding protein